MTKPVVFFLTFSLFFSSLAVVYVRHQHRLEYTRLSIENAERDDLFIEWNTLMIAMSTWSSLNRVENSAKSSLAMRAPKAEEIISMERK
jgi:cell division protein FtsL